MELAHYRHDIQTFLPLARSRGKLLEILTDEPDVDDRRHSVC